MKFIIIFIAIFNLTISTAMAGYYDVYKIASYRYDQFSSFGTSSIDLYDANKKKVGILIFKSVETSQLPVPSQDTNGLVRLYYTSSSLQNVVDLLRNESPIRLNYWHGSPVNSSIGTASYEGVGEGE